MATRKNKKIAFTVERTKWWRGQCADNSMLRRGGDGKQCCLGFLALACGFSKDEITGAGSPAELAHRPGKRFPKTLVVPRGEPSDPNKVATTVLCNDLMVLNDRVGVAGRAREAKLKRLFAKGNISVRFK